MLGNWQRFGAAWRIEGRRKISNLEFINGLSAAYRRARGNSAVLAIIYQSMKTKVCQKLAISPHEPTAKVIEACRQEAGDAGGTIARVPALLGDLDAALEKKGLTDKELRSLVLSCDKIAHELAGPMTTDNPAKRGAQ